MLISELIAHLEDAKEKWGDASCEVHYEQEGDYKTKTLTHVIERPLFHVGVYLKPSGETVLALSHTYPFPSDDEVEQKSVNSTEMYTF
jgi:hypothetical protein